MGDWHLDEHDQWVYDPDAPSPVAGVTALAPRGGAYVAVYEHHGDGQLYGRVDPGQFDLFDDVDSTTITDDGGPPDAA